MPISRERVEAAARAVGKALGYEYSGQSVLEAASAGDARCSHWETLARAALNARSPRYRRLAADVSKTV